MKIICWIVIALTAVGSCFACYRANPDTKQECDWREFGAVTDVKDQGTCEACWSFAAVAVLESYQFRKSGDYGDLQVLSEQQLIDCGYLRDPKNLGRCFDKPGSWACGGDPVAAIRAVNSMRGIYANESYPWRADRDAETEQTHRCESPPGEKYLTSRFSATFAVNINNEKLKALIVEHGPVAATIFRPDDWCRRKSRTIYTAECEGDLNHAVAIVGFGEEGDRAYWIIKNGYGKKWAEDGYIRLAMRDDNKDCGLRQKIAYII